jgi:dephospho-CoA kinase
VVKIAVTGGFASGKSTVIKILAVKLNAPIFDSDKVANIELKNNSKIIKLFNTLDRKKIANIVFNSNKKLKELENIIHPAVKEKLNSFFTKNKAKKYTISEVPLLFEANMDNLFDVIIVIVSDKSIRKNRIKAADFEKRKHLSIY